MLFGNAFDAVTRIVGIVVRRGNEITNLIRAEGRCSKPLRHQVDDLADIELVSHETYRQFQGAPCRSSRRHLRELFAANRGSGIQTPGS